MTESTVFLLGAGLLVALALLPLCLAVPKAARRWPVLLLCLLCILLALALYLRLGAWTDVRLAERWQHLPRLPAAEQADAYAGLLSDFQRRVEQRPDSVGYRRILAEDAVARQDWKAAQQHYGHLNTLSGGHPEVQAMALTARFMAANRRLDEALRQDMLALIALEPEQPAVRGMLGMGAYEAGDYTQAIEHWQWALRGLEAGDPVAESLRAGILRARQALGDDEAVAPDHWLTVQLQLAGDRNAWPEDSVVFVFVSEAAGSMPVAARKLALSDLPLSLSFADGDGLQGRNIREAGQVQVVVRLAAAGVASGSAGGPEARSDWFDSHEPPADLQLTLDMKTGASRP